MVRSRLGAKAVERSVAMYKWTLIHGVLNVYVVVVIHARIVGLVGGVCELVRIAAELERLALTWFLAGGVNA
jgi:hypothetical protein